MVSREFAENDAAREIRAAIMFIDVEGFSRIMGKKNPEIVFSELRSCLTRISAIVESHGGQVNKTLGNGLLCYFTHFDSVSISDEELRGFIESALQSAIGIQREWAQELLQSETSPQEKLHKNWHALPLRIGINAGSVYWGNASINGVSPDYTVVGETVNLAKRLEGSADVFKVLVSPAAKLLLDSSTGAIDFGVGATWGRRFLQIKHQTGLFEAWECNPFGADSELLRGAQRLVRTGHKRTSTRVPWLCHVALNATLPSGPVARVVDFSENGFCLEFSQAFARKEHLDVAISTARADWNTILVSKGLANVTCDVRWVENVGQMHWHGVAFVGFPQEQARALSDLLIQFNNRASEEF